MPSAIFLAALELTRDWCRIPSVRGDEEAIALQARVIADWLERELGAEIVLGRAMGGGRPPVIHARLDVGMRETVILYNMYDVVPASAEGWAVDPFGGGTVDLDGVGPSFVARGAENNKGPLCGMLCVLKDLVDRSALGVNVEILIEGEEESGSGSLRAYLLDAACPVQRARAALFPSFCEYGGGPPRVYLGFSGIAKGEVTVAGGAWGGPSAPIHSSNAPWIANPASRLIEALALLGDPPTGSLGGVALDSEAEAIVERLAATFDPAAELRFRHTRRYAREGDARTLLTHVLSTTSINISSLSTMPPDGDAVIPCAARAGFELRCPPLLDPALFIDGFKRLLADRGLDGVSINLADCYPGARFSGDTAGVRALLAAYAGSSREPQVWPWAIGAAPAYAFAPHADCFLIGGAGRGGNAHGVNEFLTLEGFDRFLASITLWLGAVATERPPDGARC